MEIPGQLSVEINSPKVAVDLLMIVRFTSHLLNGLWIRKR